MLELLLHPFNSLFSKTTWISRYQKGKSNLYFNEARDDGILGCSGISWTICKQSAPCCRPITTPTPHRLIFYRPDALPVAQPTVSKHWRHARNCQIIVSIIFIIIIKVIARQSSNILKHCVVCVFVEKVVGFIHVRGRPSPVVVSFCGPTLPMMATVHRSKLAPRHTAAFGVKLGLSLIVLT